MYFLKLKEFTMIVNDLRLKNLKEGAVGLATAP
jgi:hypothetical protein